MRINPQPAKKCEFLVSTDDMCMVLPDKEIKAIRTFTNRLSFSDKGEDFNKAIIATSRAIDSNKPIILMMGAHPIKVGLTPLIQYVLKNLRITHLAVNGAFIIHDVEMALFGRTSEHVETTLKDGKFGMCDETAKFIFDHIVMDIGLGESMLNVLDSFHDSVFSRDPHPMTVSVHTAFGADTIHYHPLCNDVELITALRIDLDRFCNILSNLDGGVVINIGSAVILPEVFLKCLNTARNNGHMNNKNFTAINFDMISHYRPNKTILERTGAAGYEFIGYHEIMLPLFFYSVASRLMEG